MVENVPSRQEIDFKKKNVSARKLQVKKGELKQQRRQQQRKHHVPKK